MHRRSFRESPRNHMQNNGSIACLDRAISACAHSPSDIDHHPPTQSTRTEMHPLRYCDRPGRASSSLSSHHGTGIKSNPSATDSETSQTISLRTQKSQAISQQPTQINTGHRRVSLLVWSVLYSLPRSPRTLAQSGSRSHALDNGHHSQSLSKEDRRHHKQIAGCCVLMDQSSARMCFLTAPRRRWDRAFAPGRAHRESALRNVRCVE